MTLSERRLRRSMEESGYNDQEIEYAVDTWADKVLQERIDSDVEAQAKAKEAKLRQLDSRAGGLSDVAAYRKADGLIFKLPEGLLAFARDYGTENRLAELAMAVRWGIREGLVHLKSFDCVASYSEMASSPQET